jgi:hypothetical protein
LKIELSRAAFSRYAKIAALIIPTLAALGIFAKVVRWVDTQDFNGKRLEAVAERDSLLQKDFFSLRDVVYRDDELLDSLRVEISLAAPAHDYIYFLHSLDRVNKRLDDVEDDIRRLRRGDRSELELDGGSNETKEFTHITRKE